VVVGCVLGDGGGYTGGTPAGDGGPTVLVDGGGGAEAGSSGGPGSPDAPGGAVNLLGNGDFELGCANGWTSDDPFMSTQLSDVAHGGAHSCRLCSAAFDAGAGVSAGFDSDYRQPLAAIQGTVGQTYDSAIWVRNDTIGGPPFAQAVVVLEELSDGGVIDHSDTVIATPSDAWTRLGTTKTLTAGGGSIRFSLALHRQSDQTACILVDDASVTSR
jgi:hypothetical protein